MKFLLALLGALSECTLKGNAGASTTHWTQNTHLGAFGVSCENKIACFFSLGVSSLDYVHSPYLTLSAHLRFHPDMPTYAPVRGRYYCCMFWVVLAPTTTRKRFCHTTLLGKTHHSLASCIVSVAVGTSMKLVRCSSNPHETCKLPGRRPGCSALTK